jgi:epoxyqueuosine reductase
MTDISKEAIKNKILELYKAELKTLTKELSGEPVLAEPDVRIVSANDLVIKNLKTVIGDFHWSPQEALSTAFTSDSKVQNHTAVASTVISWCLPASEAARKTNRKEDYYPSLAWAWTRTFGENMNNRMKKQLSSWLTEKGFPSTAPGILPEFGTIQETSVGIASQWSERHYAWAAGHGTFSISGGLITRHGIAHRLGSVVTSLPLEADEREYGDDPFAWCLKSEKHPKGGPDKCGICIKRCPVGSIGNSAAKRDKDLCNEHYMKHIAAQFGKRYDWEGIYGCGLCQTGVPCEFKRP